jgi:hypothetical protein
MKLALRTLIISVVALLTLCAMAQDEPRLDPKDPSYHPAIATVIFDLDFPGATPSHYSVAVNSDGDAGYLSNGEETNPATGASTGDPNVVRFKMSTAGRERVFQLAQKLNFFNGSFNYTRSRIANTGVKTLVFADSSRHNMAVYNYSQNPDIQQLTKFFQSVSATMEYGRRLEHDLRFDKLDLYKQLQQMLSDAQEKNLAELQAIVPVLQKISGDASVMRIARVDADRLLAMAGAPLATR